MMMNLRRTDEAEARIPEITRSARFLNNEDQWFFRTREGILLGPYSSKFDAELSASLLIARLAQLGDKDDAVRVIEAFAKDPSNATINNSQERLQESMEAYRRRHAKATGRGRFLYKAWEAVTNIQVATK